ncbi:transient receptor potential cation channel subfamily A member 1 homolog isoform X2 [Dysidea avara]|uniref:transient receptor potential cation channel subfamily A member 1 homolog isoform X2 n=1 Tax=Dysidea avara TaxID=196820 RepID=UPI003330FC8F
MADDYEEDGARRTLLESEGNIQYGSNGMASTVPLDSSPVPQEPLVKSLLQAVKDGKKDSALKQWISYLENRPDEERKNLINAIGDSEQLNVLHMAAIRNDAETLEKFCTFGADADQCTDDEAKNPPLVLAAQHVPCKLFEEARIEALGANEQDDDIEIEPGDRKNNSLLALLHHSKDVNKQNSFGTTALHVACKRGSTVMVKKLLQCRKRSIDVNRADYQKNRPLHIACANGNQAMCKLLIDAGALFNEKNNDGMNPLHVAALEHNQPVVEMFFTHKFVAHIKGLLADKDKDGHTPFLLAVKSGDARVVESFTCDRSGADTIVNYNIGGEIFVRHGIDITVRNNNSENALHLAAKADHTKILEKLRLEMCKDKDKNKTTMLKWWKDEDDKTMLECKDKDGMTPLLTATVFGSIGAVNLFIVKPGDDEPVGKPSDGEQDDEPGDDANDDKYNANVSATDNRECNVIHLAVENGDVNVLKAVMDGNTDIINMRNNKFQVPLHIACKCGNYEVAMELLKNGAKVTLTDIYGKTPLHIATFNGHLKIVKLLISHHADIDAVNETDGHTPLTYAARHGHEEIVDYLLEKGSNVNGKFEGAKNYKISSWNTSPLLIASYYGHVKVVERLLEQDGVDVALEDYEVPEKGKTPLKCNCLVFAIINGHSEVASAIVNSDHWEKAMRWRDNKPVAVTGQDGNSGNNGDCTHTTGNKTPLKLLIRHMPDVAAKVMDRCIITPEKPVNNICTRKYNYEFIDDICIQQNTSHRQTNNTARVECNLHDFAKNHPLQIMVDYGRANLMEHPLTAKLLLHKWWSFGIWLYLTRFLAYAIFVAFLTSFAMESPTPESEVCKDVNTSHVSVSSIDDIICEDDYNQSFLRVAAIIIYILSVIRILVEIVQFFVLRIRYLLGLENYLQIFSFVSSMIFVSYGLQSGCQCPESWQWQIGAFSLLISWLSLILFLKEFPLTGIYIEMFIHIIFTFLTLLIFALMLVISFGLTFYMIFFRPGERSGFSSPARALIETAVMSTGGFDFDGMFFNSQEDAEAGIDLFYPEIAYILWIVFMILMPILLSNLLVGLAVDDVKEIRKAAELRMFALTVNFILRIEEIPYLHKRYKKDFDDETFRVNDDRSYLRNQFHRTPVWNTVIRLLFYKNKKNDADEMPATGSMDQVQAEIAQLKALIDEQNKRQDVLLQYIKQTSSNVEESRGEIVQMKALIDEQNKRQDVLLHFIEQTMPLALKNGGGPSDEEELLTE